MDPLFGAKQMPIFVARTYNNLIESVVLARNYELAQAYWQGLGIIAHSVTEHNESDLKNHPTGVLPLVKTMKQNASPFGKSSEEYLVIIK